MTLLITGGDSRLARAVALALGDGRPVRVVDRRFSSPPAAVDHADGDLRDPQFVAEVTKGASAVLHLAPIAPLGGDASDDLDHAARGTYQLYGAAVAGGAQRFILGSTLDLFDTLPAHWRVAESWRPRPSPTTANLCAFLAELEARELARDSGLLTICLRFGVIVGDDDTHEQAFDPRWVHLDDAVAGVLRALDFVETGWERFHIAAAGPRARVRHSSAGRDALGYQPQHDFRAHWPASLPLAMHEPRISAPLPPRPIRNVAIFGAGGPLAAAATRELAADYILRLTDLRPLDELAAAQPQSPGAPLPLALGAPHEWRVVDVRDPQAVAAACAGMDAIINCTVVREDPVEAWRVNLLGAYHVARAAVAHQIRRVVHTGPYQVGPTGATSYTWDDLVTDDAPPRPGSGHGAQLYFHTKYLAQELCRTFATYYGLEIPVLLFSNFVNPDQPPGEDLYALSVSWADAARALRRALEVPTLPSPYEVLHINADLPHGVFSNDKAKRLLGWQPRDSLEAWWSDALPPQENAERSM